jgi:transcriptional regulator with XRE-family HTH domain
MPAKTNLSSVMKAQGRTNRWLSSQMGKSINTITLWSTGKVSIPLESLYSIAEILGVTIYELLPEKMIYVESINKNSASKKIDSNKKK